MSSSVDKSFSWTADDLSFTSRNEKGHMNWFDIEPLESNYYHAHQYHGESLARELLSMKSEGCSKIKDSDIAWILYYVGQSKIASESLKSGFFSVIGKALDSA